ncbi:MAG: ATP-binding protein [Rhodothermales bacterium]
MLVGGILGIVAIIAFVGGNVLLLGKPLAVRYSGSDPTTLVGIWDKLLILLLSLTILVLARTRVGLQWGRLIVAIMLFAVSIAMLLDDIARGDISGSAAYMSLVMLIAVGTMPYHAWQILPFGFGITGVHFLCARYLPPLFGQEELTFGMGRILFMMIITFLCTGISALLYSGRYEQYRARRKVEQLKEEITEYAEKLREMEQLKARFFANVSHEFRTPLTLILGPVEDALNDAHGPVSSTLRRQLQMMKRNGFRLQRLINQLLDLSKLEAGRMHLHVRRRNLVAFLRGLVQSFSSLAERKHVTLQFDADLEDHALFFDADKLEKIVSNLLSNAFKFTPEHGTIRVKVRKVEDEKGSFVEMCVRDTGAGISAEELPYVFDRFHQVAHSRAHEQEGTGIGLALAKELVELHGGEIHVESEPGFGCEFIVRLPQGSAHLSPDDLVEADSDAAPLEVEHSEAHWLDAEVDAIDETTLDQETWVEAQEDAPTILIVEDNADVREYLKSNLVLHYHIVEATNGVEGLQQARSILPDLIISDVMMPEMDGVALCRALKTDDQLNHIPVILLTAKASEVDKLEGLKTGVDDYLYKPFNAEELLARMENLIELRRMLRHRFSDEVVVGPSEIAIPSAEAMFLERVREVVEAHMGNSNFGVEWLADEVGFSVRQLRRRLKAATRLSPGGYIRKMRLERARQLLAQQAGTVAEIAYAVGFQDPDYFSRLFKQTVGVSPSEYRTEGT